MPVETVGHYYEIYSNFSSLSQTYKIGQGDFDFVSIQNNQSRQSLDDANSMIKEKMDTLRYIEWDYKLYIIDQISIFFNTAYEFYALGYQVLLGWLFIHILAQWFMLPLYFVLATIWLSGVFIYSITVVPMQLLILAVIVSFYAIVTFIILFILIYLYEYTLWVAVRFFVRPLTIVGYILVIPGALPLWIINELLSLIG